MRDRYRHKAAEPKLFSARVQTTRLEGYGVPNILSPYATREYSRIRPPSRPCGETRTFAPRSGWTPTSGRRALLQRPARAVLAIQRCAIAFARVARTGVRMHWPIQASCRPWETLTCSICGRDAPCVISKATGKPWCRACKQRWARYARCGAMAPVRGGTTGAPLCSACAVPCQRHRVGAEYCVTLCDLGVFVDQAAEPGPAAEPGYLCLLRTDPGARRADSGAAVETGGELRIPVPDQELQAISASAAMAELGLTSGV